MRPMARGHRVGQRGADGNLDPLDRIHDQQPQLPIEDVAVKNLVERDAWFEIMPVGPVAAD